LLFVSKLLLILLFSLFFVCFTPQPNLTTFHRKVWTNLTLPYMHHHHL
jgi:hypothetical protein